ncbi:Alpha/Beta hydrolase protein [Dimargaris cristalligena]|uniref:Alpha/Beta hydrolase protein n=1 Tax=Dimargaris cristalligena TaxID=215637 RepID=A0A4V1J4R3_9FUNG|nr:Alpha/Beta hydrolase protein [Dimargaris cristalligena]|eukprot:RKP36459.1 Alpha/Beta hydrolase protein [Dimargaris cristalligena]
MPASDAYVAVNDRLKSVILAYRGTSRPLAAIQDLKIGLQKFFPDAPGVDIHRGFMESYLARADSIYATVEELVNRRYPGYDLVITGHSLGGAQALLAAVDFSRRQAAWIPRIRLYTYGQPRVGDRDFAQEVQRLGFYIRRITNGEDLVPRLPPQFLNYLHCGTEVWINNNHRPWPGQEFSTVLCGPVDSIGEDPMGCNSVAVMKLEVQDHLKYWNIGLGSLILSQPIISSGNKGRCDIF